MTITLEHVLELLAIAGLTSAAVSAAILWMTKEWLTEKIRARIKSEYDEKLETHKAQLKAQNDVEIERLKSQLSIAAAERQLRFAKLHERRGEGDRGHLCKHAGNGGCLGRIHEAVRDGGRAKPPRARKSVRRGRQ